MPAGLPPWLLAVVGGVFAVTLALLGLTVTSLLAGPSPTPSLYGPVELPAERNPRGLPVAPRVGAMAPDFELAQPDGQVVRLSDLRGEVVVLNFWASWCAPCRAEMAALQEAADRWAGQNVRVIGVNVQEDASTITSFTDRFRLRFTVVQDLTGRVTATSYRVLGLPWTFFIDRDGMIRDFNIREMDAATIERKLRATTRERS